MLKRHWKLHRPKLLKLLARGRFWARQKLPPGGRLVVGLLLMAGAALAFLPVLGLWMLPLGLVIASLDVRPLWRRMRRCRLRVRTLR